MTYSWRYPGIHLVRVSEPMKTPVSIMGRQSGYITITSPVPLLIPYGLLRDGTKASVIKSRNLTAWHMSRPKYVKNLRVRCDLKFSFFIWPFERSLGEPGILRKISVTIAVSLWIPWRLLGLVDNRDTNQVVGPLESRFLHQSGLRV
jgi:hypothetical protein